MSGRERGEQFLTGRCALVTGAAKRIGAAIARSLAEQGAAVVIHFRESEAEARALAEQLQAAGAEAFLVTGDLADAATATSLVDQAAQAANRPIDILINNASIFEPGGLQTVDAEQWDRHQAVNLRAPFLLARTFAAQLPASGGADIINLNDIRALQPGADYLAYTASKVGLHGLTRSLALALAPRVRVNELALGAVLPPDKSADEYEHVLREDLPAGRFPTVAEVTDAVLSLLADEATGRTIRIDGDEEPI